MKDLMRLAAACLLAGFAVTVSAAGDAAAGAERAPACTPCHGVDGNGVSANPLWPKLAGQHADYLFKQLQNIHSQERENPQMAGLIAGLDPQAMADLAVYFARQEAAPAVADAPEEVIRAGEKLYRGGNLATGVSACAGCHGPAGLGNGPAKFPRLAGQHAAYVEAQLKAFRGEGVSGQRTNDISGMMRGVTKAMTDAEIKAVAAYIQGLRVGN